jgi:hypothetical protein
VTCCLVSFPVTEHSTVPGESVWYWDPGTVLQAPRRCIPSWSLSSQYVGQGKHEVIQWTSRVSSIEMIVLILLLQNLGIIPSAMIMSSTDFLFLIWY